MKKTLLVLLLAAASLASAVSYTIAADALTASLEAVKVVAQADGREGFVAAEAAAPGDIIEYRATYANTTDRTLTNVAPEIPIPEGLTWLAAAKTPLAPVSASLNGATFSPLPLRDAVGQPVALEQVRALRWSIPELKPAASVTIIVRATVNRTLPFALPSSSAGNQQPTTSN
ncbi:hypothetical protein Ga0100231_020405 [Opitutaceae bacterium TAV4]|nr:hypothetical protein Ga0100231_020405 [Opitutaceae bacterium TAV4]RRK00412.1 hypothetical protein Ga0100230_021215 [Opitutaceae bacterium TAV3]